MLALTPWCIFRLSQVALIDSQVDLGMDLLHPFGVAAFHRRLPWWS